jgi:hypothetical protein
MKTILYCRVSTSDQTLDHQVTQARAAGFAINEVVSDHGVSGVSTASLNAIKASGCSICSAVAMCSLFAGSTGSGETMQT